MTAHRVNRLRTLTLRARQRGLTLIELMVSLVVGLVLVLAAALAYLGTRNTASSLDQVSQLNESGKLALDIIAREIQMSCYYPMTFGVGTTTIPSCDDRNPLSNQTGFPAVVAALPMLFGCDSGIVQHTQRTAVNSTRCNTATAGASAGGSLVVSYFVWPRETGGTTGLGTASATDCLRQSVLQSGSAGDSVNTDANAPQFVSNIFSLRPFTYTNSDGVAVSTNSLSCEGNGNIAATASRQPMLSGVEQMVLRYVVQPGYVVKGFGGAGRAFYTAADLNSAATNDDLLTNWRAVVTVRVCLLMSTADPVRQVGGTNNYRNCDGTTTNYATGERRVFKAFERNVAVRNNSRW